MAEQFYTILTNVGKAKIANALSTGTKVNLTKMKIGDSNGTYYNPSESQTELVHKVYECNVTSVEVDESNPNWITITAAIPSDVGGFSIREVGVFDDSNSLIAIGKYPETYKPVASDGSVKELYIKMTLEVVNASSVELKIDPTIILATKKDIANINTKVEDVNDLASKKAEKNDLQAVSNELNVQKARIDTFTSLASGSTTGDAELIDARIGQDGKTYKNTGSAVRGQMKDIIGDLTYTTGLTRIHFTPNKNIPLGDKNIGEVISLTPSNVSGWNYAIVDCYEGELFTLTGEGGTNPRLWGFLDNNNILLKRARRNLNVSNFVLKAPKNASKLVLNIKSSNATISAYRGVSNSTTLNESIENLVTGYGENLIRNAKGGNINTGVNIGDTIDLNERDLPEEYTCVVVDCVEGDKFRVKGVGGANPRLWAFVDNNNKLLINQKQNWGKLEEAFITAPKGASKLIVNTNLEEEPNPEIRKYITSDNIQDMNKKMNKLISDTSSENLVVTHGQSGNITTGVAIGENVPYTPSDISGFKCVIIPCSPGDKFIVRGTGGDNPRLWAFAKDNILVCSQSSGWSYIEQSLLITCPEGADTLIANFSTKNNSIAQLYAYKEDKLDTPNKLIEPIPEDTMSNFINGMKFSRELHEHLTDLKKDGDLMVHVSTFCIINDMLYGTYYANTHHDTETPSEHTARFVYCPLSNMNNKTFIDLQNINDTFNGKPVTEIYDTILLRKDDDTLYLMWTAKVGGAYSRLYRTYTISTNTLSDVGINKFTVGNITNNFDISGMSSALLSNNIAHKNLEGDIGIMQKLSSRVENGTTYYYTGCYVGPFNCIIKSADLVNWIFVTQPTFYNESQWENSVYIKDDKAYYFCRQYSSNGTGFLSYYDLNTLQWHTPIFVNDTQSRSDFFEYKGKLYLIHAPKDRQHLAIMQIDTKSLDKSKEVQTAKVPDYFYPYVQVYNDELYVSFTQSRKHIYVSKFTIGSISIDTILSKFMELFSIK